MEVDILNAFNDINIVKNLLFKKPIMTRHDLQIGTTCAVYHIMTIVQNKINNHAKEKNIMDDHFVGTVEPNVNKLFFRLVGWKKTVGLLLWIHSPVKRSPVLEL